jgi:hypothetical protein
MARSAGHTTHVPAEPSRRVQERDLASEDSRGAGRRASPPSASAGGATSLAEVRRRHADAEVTLGLR